MDQQMIMNVKQHASQVDFLEGKTPLRSLDLGCGVRISDCSTWLQQLKSRKVGRLGA
jgi:hypothetical protein